MTMPYSFRGKVRAVIGGRLIQLEDDMAYQGYLTNSYDDGDMVEMEVRPLPTAGKDKIFQYLYHGVYTPLSKHMRIPVEELDGRMKGKFLVVNPGTDHEYVRDKKNLNKKALIEFVDAVKAFGVAQGCDIEELKE